MRSRHFLVSVFACLLGAAGSGGCGGGGDASHTPGAGPAGGSAASASASSSASSSASGTIPAPAVDHENVPPFAPAAPACSPVAVATPVAPATGDARAMRTALRALARERATEPPALDAFRVGCVATRADVAHAYQLAGTAFTRRREHAVAALYYRRALDADPSSLEARFALVKARSALGDVDGALYQLEVLRNAGPGGDRYVERSFREGALAPLRLKRAYWAWAHDPVPDALPLLGTNAPDSILPPTLASMSFEPAIAGDPSTIFERVRLARGHYGTILGGVHDALDGYLRSPRSATTEDYVGFDVSTLGAIGLAPIAGPSLYRLTPTESVLAIPFFGEFEGTPELVGIVAVGPDAGPHRIVQLVRSSSGCATPALVASRDRRAVGWLTSCSEGDPRSFGRCLLHAEAGQITMRCGGGAEFATLGGSQVDDEGGAGDRDGERDEWDGDGDEYERYAD